MKKLMVLFMFSSLFFIAASSVLGTSSLPPDASLAQYIAPRLPAERIFIIADKASATDLVSDMPESELPSETPSDRVEAPAESPALTADAENAPMIALTFDDGPSEITPRIIELLTQYDAVATFCVVGNRLSRYEDTARMIVESGSELVGHSWNHKNLSKLSADDITQQLADTNAKIEELAGYGSAFCRLPYGAINQNVRDVCEELGLSILNWSVDTKDWKFKDADAVYEHIMEHAREGAIILCHDMYDTTAEAMERVIPELIEQGYRLVTVTELLTSSDAVLEPGKVYTRK